MVTTKDRYSMNLTEEEDIKKRWKNTKIYKKELSVQISCSVVSDSL